jgi:predicted amidohydrolase YtcJ
VLIRNARTWPPSPGTADGLRDVRIEGERVTECAPGLRAGPGEADIDAAGHALLPGLHDHHVHLHALAAARASTRVGPPQVETAADLAGRLREADAAASPGAWLRCVGYHESVAGLLDRWALDRLVPSRPLRIQHRAGGLWILNSAAAERVGLDACELPGVERGADGTPTGRLWRMDRWLATRIPATPPDLAAVSACAAALGVTGFTDATPGATARDIAALGDAIRAGTLVQRVCAMAPAGSRFPRGAPVARGPVKIMLDDDTLPPLADLAASISLAHAGNQAVAVHCVTRVQLILTLAALDDAGRLPGDRIEHGAVIPAETIRDLRGLTVVSQPHFLAERAAQYAADVDPADRPDLWRLRSLASAGVAVAAGSDAPFGGADPWRVMRSAVTRPPVFAAGESVSPGQALRLFLGQPGAPGAPRRIAPGQPADLVLLEVPPADALRSLASDLVAATWIRGRPVYPGRTAGGAPLRD